MYVSSTSHAAAVALHKALHRSSQAFTLLLLCSDGLKKFLKVPLQRPPLFLRFPAELSRLITIFIRIQVTVVSLLRLLL